MRGPTDSIRGLIRELSGEVDGAAAFLREIGFRVSVAKLQSQMVSLFVRRVARRGLRRRLRPRPAQPPRARPDAAIRLPRGSAGAPVRRPRRSRSTSQRRRKRGHAASPRFEDDARARGQRPDRGSGKARCRRGGPSLFGEISEQIATAQTELTEFAAAAALGRATASSSTATTTARRPRTNARQRHSRGCGARGANWLGLRGNSIDFGPAEIWRDAVVSCSCCWCSGVLAAAVSAAAPAAWAGQRTRGSRAPRARTRSPRESGLPQARTYACSSLAG